MQKKKAITALIIAMAVFLSVAFLYFRGYFQRIDYIAYDGIVKAVRMKKPVSSRVAVILIDEQSLAALNPILGRWPWPRTIYSDLLEFLSMGKPRAVLFDILFPEYQNKGRMGLDDRQLVKATGNSGFAYHAMQLLIDKQDEKNKGLLNRPMPPDFTEKFGIKGITLNKAFTRGNNKYYLPFPELYRASRGMAVVEFSPDSDGVFRRNRPIREYRGSYYPVMGIAPLIGDEKLELDRSKILIGNEEIPLDRDGFCLLNFYGDYKPYSISGIFASLQQIRRGDVENLMIDPSEFRDKIVFVGASAVGVEDLKPTPISPKTPGVFLHATLASNFLQNDFLSPPDRTATIFYLLLFSVLPVMGIFYLKRFQLKFLFPLFALGGWIVFYSVQFSRNSLYEPAPPAAAILLASMVSFGYLVITEGREKLKVRRMFSQYVSPDVLTSVVDQFSEYASSDQGSRVDISVLFCDIRGFTSFSERTPPEKVVQMLNCYFSEMSDVIFSHKGTIDKFIGDAIMAFWGAPIKISDHPERAVAAALDMVRRLKRLNEEIRDQGLDFEVRIGIGINSGEAVLGNIGSERKLNYTMVGDTINLASRLEGLTKQFCVPIIISEFTRQRLPGSIPCRILDKVQVRGKKDKIKIYEPVLPDESGEECQTAQIGTENQE